MSDKTKDVVDALACAAATIAALEGVPGWVISSSMAILKVVERLISNHASDAALQDAVDTLAELGKAAMDEKKFGSGA